MTNTEGEGFIQTRFAESEQRGTREMRTKSGLVPGVFHMPDDLVVVRNRDADEAGDYRVARHGDVAADPQWEITDINPKDLD